MRELLSDLSEPLEHTSVVAKSATATVAGRANRDRLGIRRGAPPVSERLAREITTLPLYPQKTEDDVAYVVDHLREFFARRTAATAQGGTGLLPLRVKPLADLLAA